MEKTPWSLSLYALANRSLYAVLRNQLVYDGLVSPSVLERWDRKNLFPGSERGSPGGVLYYLRQPFFHRFDKHYLAFYTVAKENIGFCHTTSFTRVANTDGRPALPYGGELLSRI